ncbi:MAG: PAS domain-containing sensor histidine kinase [Armatimonadota bacterium]
MLTTNCTMDELATSEAARQNFIQIFQHVPVGMVLVDNHLNILAANPALASFLGYDLDELLTLNIASITHPEDLGPSVEMRQEVVIGKHDLFVTEKRYIRKDGAVVWGKVMAGRLGQLEDQVTIGVVEDITARKQADVGIAALARTLGEERNFYLTALKYLPNGVIIVNKAGDIVFHNEPVERMWGIKVPDRMEALEGKLEAFRPDGTPLEAENWPLVRALRLGEHVGHELIKNVLPDGSIVHMHSTAAPVLGTNGEVVAAVGVLSDITPMKQAQAELERLVGELEATREDLLRSQDELQHHRDALQGTVLERETELEERQQRLRALAADLVGAEERERQRIAGTIHDEIANTLAVIKLNLSAYRAAADPSQTGFVTEILSTVDEAIAQSRAIMAELSPPGLRDHGLPEALRWWGERVAQRHGLEVTFELKREFARPPREVEVALFQATKELIQNAVKHAHAQRLDLSVTCEHSEIRIEVADNGVGFEKGGTTLTETGGFGLMHIKERMAYLGGRLDIMSRPGHGTVASLRLPLHCGDAPPIPPITSLQ